MELRQEIAISMDFYGDWIALLRESLENKGYCVGQTDEDFKVCCLYFNAAKRKIAPRPRRILISREFSCPPDHLPGLQLLEDKIRSGQDLTPHLSRKILIPNYDDLVLNDWGIHHFHLGVAYDKGGLIQGTPYMLLARVTSDEFYMIDVVGHELWHHRRYVEILHANWPRSIELWKCGDGGNLVDPPDDEEIKILRGGHICYMVQTEDGTVYSPIGGGYATSGMSVEASRQCAWAERLLERMEVTVRKQGKEFLLRQQQVGTVTCSSFNFRFELGSDGPYAVDERAMTAFRVGDRRRCEVLYGHPSLPLKIYEGLGGNISKDV